MEISGWTRRAEELRVWTYTLYLACRRPSAPWYARAAAILVVAYAFSPIDLIPDFVPVLGYLDDLVLIPLGVALVLRLFPSAVLEECRAEARERLAQGAPASRVGAFIVVGIWVLLAAVAAGLLLRAV